MNPRTFTLLIMVFVCICLVPWEGSGLGAPASCQAMTQITKLNVLSEVKAGRKRVNLLDLCESTNVPEDWKTAMSAVDIGESPAAGTEKVINPQQLKSFIENFLKSQGYEASQVQIVLPDKISVRRLSMLVPREQIEAIYKDFITSKAPWNPQDMVIRAVYCSETVELPSGDMSYEVTANPRERFMGNVGVTIQFNVNGEKERALRVTGKVELYQNVVHAVRALKRNDVISEADIELQKINVSDAPDRFASSLEQVAGKRVLRETGVHKPIALSDLDNPAALKRGSTVTIVYEQGGLRLTAKGQTREDATIGSSIRVVNIMTNRTISCRVLDATTVQAMR